MKHEVATRRVLYEIPGMQSVSVRNASFTGAGGHQLPLRIYGDAGPAVVILEGLPDAGFQKHVGCMFMEMEWSISMAQLIASCGMTAVTHSNRDPLADADALLAHLTSNGRKPGIWSTSGHGAVAVAAAAGAACAVLMNPVLHGACPPVPLFITRAGKDETPGLNPALDAFVAQAIADDRPLTLVNYPGAPHSFDLFLDRPETRCIIRQGLDFLRTHLM